MDYGNENGGELVRILLAEDDDDDFYLTDRALKENRLRNEISRVKDGEELMEYLRHEGKFAGSNGFPAPSLILLDLNMPRKDGREALKEIKSDPKLRHIPVVVLTTSRAEEDVVRSYQLGVNSFITKPVTFLGLVEAMKALGEYWFEVVVLPS
ncbi:MAG TPA: response regulator [Terriglobales bacterium]|jgi:two-component system, response regulator|nr:response regulator [Terriglobales bacterium]